jgi:hypothetical protein
MRQDGFGATLERASAARVRTALEEWIVSAFFADRAWRSVARKHDGVVGQGKDLRRSAVQEVPVSESVTEHTADRAGEERVAREHVALIYEARRSVGVTGRREAGFSPIPFK